MYDVVGAVYVERDGEVVRLHNNDPLYVGDKIIPDATHPTAFELLIGGRIGVKPDTPVVIVNEGEVTGADGTPIALRSGGVWAKFTKAKEPLTIQTRGGVMGVKG
jgi:hypothetical protein